MAMNTYIVWGYHNNLVIRDTIPKMYDRIIEFMVETYFKRNPLFNILKMQEEEGINEQYAVLVSHILHNECSIVAIDEQTNTIYAVALLKWMTKEWRSWIQMLELLTSPKLNDFIILWHHVITNHMREFPNKNHDSMHIFHVEVTKELHNDEEFWMKFFGAICESGRHMKMPRITCFGLSKEKQEILQEIGLTKVSQIIFAMYITRGQERPFISLRDVNEQYFIYFEKKLEPLIPYYEMPPFPPKDLKPVLSTQGEAENPVNSANQAVGKRRSSA